MKTEQDIRKQLARVNLRLYESPAPEVVKKNLLALERDILMWVLDEKEKTDG